MLSYAVDDNLEQIVALRSYLDSTTDDDGVTGCECVRSAPVPGTESYPLFLRLQFLDDDLMIVIRSVTMHMCQIHGSSHRTGPRSPEKFVVESLLLGVLLCLFQILFDHLHNVRRCNLI